MKLGKLSFVFPVPQINEQIHENQNTSSYTWILLKTGQSYDAIWSWEVIPNNGEKGWI